MNKKVIYSIGIAIGLILGFAYWYYIGCTSGTCPLTSKWYTSSLYGALFGYLVTSLGIDMTKRKKENEQIQSDNQ